MKYSKHLEKLKSRQAHWDKLNPKDQHALTRPGSQKK